MKLFQQSYSEMNYVFLTSTRTFAAIEDDDPVYTGRVVGIEWRKRKGSNPAAYNLITVDIGADKDEDLAGDYWPYQIVNEILHDLIKDCSNHSDLNSSFTFASTL